LWWVELTWLPDAHPAALSLPLLNRVGGKNKMGKLRVLIKHRETHGKQTGLGEN